MSDLPHYSVVFMLLIPCDTFECERVFSLMNDLKTSERTSMGQTTLKHLMVWYSLAKERKFEEVPVMAIQHPEGVPRHGRNSWPQCPQADAPP